MPAFDRREFLKLLGVSAIAGPGLIACSKSETGTAVAAEAADPSAGFYDLPMKGNARILHITDVHGQLNPVYFREPNVNLGVGDAFGRPPHIVGKKLLAHMGLKEGSIEEYAYTYLNFDKWAREYGRMGGFAHIKTLLDSLPTGVVAADREAHVSWFNGAAARILKLRGEQVLHRPVEVLGPLEPVGSGETRKVGALVEQVSGLRLPQLPGQRRRPCHGQARGVHPGEQRAADEEQDQHPGSDHGAARLPAPADLQCERQHRQQAEQRDQRHAVLVGQGAGAGMDQLGPGAGELGQLRVADLADRPGGRELARVLGEQAVDVLVEFAAGRAERGGAEAYFLAGRKLPWYAVALSMTGSNIGTEHFIGMVGTAYVFGLLVRGDLDGDRDVDLKRLAAAVAPAAILECIPELQGSLRYSDSRA